MDATPDYSKYSLRELRDVAARINRDAFPDRYALVSREIERRETLGEDVATAKSKSPLPIWAFFSVLFSVTGGALIGAVLSGIAAYFYNPPYGPKYGDGIDWGLGFIGCLFFGALFGFIAGLIWGLSKVNKR